MRRARVINQLREQFPDAGEWSFDAEKDQWTCTSGWSVRKYATFVGMEGDDPGPTQFRRLDTGEPIPLRVNRKRRRNRGKKPAG